jgi:acetyl esterase
VTLDQATAALLAQVAASGMKPLTELTPAEARRLEAAAAVADRGPAMATVTDRRVRTGGGSVPLRILIPRAHPRGVIAYYHGGGWVLGGIDAFAAHGRELAARTGCAVVLVGYRLAPEYRFPTAVEDSWAALQWIAAHLTEIAGERVPLLVAGDSAGGNLAAVVAQRALTAGGPALELQILVYPITDCDLNTTSYLDPASQALLSRELMIWYWDHYAPSHEARTHPDASPLRGTQLAGLPPAVILTAEHDPLRDEGELYATLLMRAGVPVRHRRFAGQMHGFFTLIGLLPGARDGLDFVTAAVDDHLARQHPAPAGRPPTVVGSPAAGAAVIGERRQ